MITFVVIFLPGTYLWVGYPWCNCNWLATQTRILLCDHWLYYPMTSWLPSLLLCFSWDCWTVGVSPLYLVLFLWRAAKTTRNWPSAKNFQNLQELRDYLKTYLLQIIKPYLCVRIRNARTGCYARVLVVLKAPVFEQMAPLHYKILRTVLICWVN